VLLLLQYGEYKQLIIDLSINPLHYCEGDVEKFRGDYLVTAFLQKSINFALPGVNPEQAAIQAFHECEEDCSVFNAWIRKLDPSDENAKVLFEIRSVFHELIGGLNPRMLKYIEDNMDFGPGSTSSISASKQIPSVKISGRPHLTESLYPFYKTIIGDRWHEFAKRPKIVKGNKLGMTVKNAKTKRVVCLEPDLNVLVQKGIGRGLRLRLRICGNPINDQGINQRLALRAYKNGGATIDLKGASERIALQLVTFLSPDRWRDLLLLARSPCTKIPQQFCGPNAKSGRWVELEKFSSTGNGFTFELETMIFLAVVRSCVPVTYWDECAVYGDDIIVPRAFYGEVTRRLEICGFVVNTSKSFSQGLFFESCGTDYFCGQPVRPAYARGGTGIDGKGTISIIPYALRLANRLRVMAWQAGSYHFCDKKWLPAYKLAVASLAAEYRLRIPFHLGDAGLISSFNEGRGNRRSRSKQHTILGSPTMSWESGWDVKCLTESAMRIASFSHRSRLYVVRNAGSRKTVYTLVLPKRPRVKYEIQEVDTPEFRHRFPARGLLDKLRPQYVPVSFWDSGFDWC